MDTSLPVVTVDVAGALNIQEERFDAVILLRQNGELQVLQVRPLTAVGLAVPLLVNAFMASLCNLINRLCFGALLRSPER